MQIELHFTRDATNIEVLKDTRGKITGVKLTPRFSRAKSRPTLAYIDLLSLEAGGHHRLSKSTEICVSGQTGNLSLRPLEASVAPALEMPANPNQPPDSDSEEEDESALDDSPDGEEDEE